MLKDSAKKVLKISLMKIVSSYFRKEMNLEKLKCERCFEKEKGEMNNLSYVVYCLLRRTGITLLGSMLLLVTFVLVFT